MPEQANSVEVIGSTTTPPAISDSGLQYMRDLLNDPGWVNAYPLQAAALRQSFDSATKVTGQDQPQVTDERTPAQRFHDRNLGIAERPSTAYELEAPNGFEPPEGKTVAETLSAARDLCSALQLDPVLAKAVVRDMLGTKEKPDPVEVANTLDRAGQNYSEAIKNANLALAHAAKRLKGEVPVKAEDLAPYALAMLALHGKQLQRWAKDRP